jgi:hypothetical protein
LPASHELAAFFLPGLVHQLANQLLTVQGQALALADAASGAQILAAVGRGADTIRIVRHLLAEPDDEVGAAPELLERLVELARVPVRERGLQLAVEPPSGTVSVAAGAFVRAVARALTALCQELPGGASGSLSLRSAVDAGTAVVELRFAAATGSLPFPLATDRLATALAVDVAVAPGVVIHGIDNGLRLEVPAGVVAPSGQA